MGSYCQLYFSNYAVDESKSFVDPWMLSFYSSRDKRTIKRRIIDHPYYFWNKPEEDLNPNKKEITYEYVISSQEAIFRLEIMGFTLSKAKKYFEKDKIHFIHEEHSFFKKYGNTLKDLKRVDYSFLHDFHFDHLLDTIKYCIDNGIYSWNIKDKIPNEKQNVFEFILNANCNFG